MGSGLQKQDKKIRYENVVTYGYDDLGEVLIRVWTSVLCTTMKSHRCRWSAAHGDGNKACADRQASSGWLT